MVENVLSSGIFLELILPFLLVFTLVFAVLDKTKLLGEGKRQINAIISLVVGLILIAFPMPRDIIVKLMPFLAVVLVILFIFMLLYGFVSGKEKDVLNKGLKITLGIIVGLSLIVAVLWISGAWDYIYQKLIYEDYAGKVWINVLLIAIIGGAMAVVLATSGKDKSDK